MPPQRTLTRLCPFIFLIIKNNGDSGFFYQSVTFGYYVLCAVPIERGNKPSYKCPELLDVHRVLIYVAACTRWHHVINAMILRLAKSGCNKFGAAVFVFWY